jgi:ABC-type uncharacterized transport system auxiliary subunit
MLNSQLVKYIVLCFTIIISFNIVSCGKLLSPVPNVPIKEYQLSVNTANDNQCAANANAPILQVSSVGVFAPYNNRNMYYSESQYQLNKYTLNQWSTDMGTMLTQLIQQKLLNSCIYSNVVSNSVFASAKYRLVVQLIDLKQLIAGNSSQMHLDVLVQLIDNNSNVVISSKEFVITTDTTPNSQGYIAGANDVIASFLDQLTKYLQTV